MLSVLREYIQCVRLYVVCDVSFLPSHYSGQQLAGFMLATVLTAHAIAGNVEVD